MTSRRVEIINGTLSGIVNGTVNGTVNDANTHFCYKGRAKQRVHIFPINGPITEVFKDPRTSTDALPATPACTPPLPPAPDI